jgi:predicted amidohydrolase
MKSMRTSVAAAAVFVLLAPAGALAREGKVALLHMNPILGDVNANLTVLHDMVGEAFANGANIAVAPELSTTGYAITRQQVIDSLGFSNPFPQLAAIRDLAIAHSGYVVVGIAEVATPKVYNTAVILGPQGLIRTQDKRTLPLWHDRGVLPFEVVPTPYGDLGVLVCADSFLSDWARILTLKGADIIVTPANWWGNYDQDKTWQIRAKENGVWFFTANRWGMEVDTRYGEPYTYDMNDAPSAVISPDGTLLQIHRAQDDAVPHNVILYQTINVPAYRIGSAENHTHSVADRRPSAYPEIANAYYRDDLGYELPPGLPPEGDIEVVTLAYRPSALPRANLATVSRLFGQRSGVGAVVLPGFGISALPVVSSIPRWSEVYPWSHLQSFVESKAIALLVTTVNEISTSGYHQSLLLVQPGKAPRLVPQIHDGILTTGSGAEPAVLDVLSARIGILTGGDVMFPETITQLAKQGIDLLLIPSAAGSAVDPRLGENNYVWSIGSLQTMWQIRTNEGLHLAASDWTGNAMVVKSGGYYVEEIRRSTAEEPVIDLSLNTANVRYKYLNEYYDGDLATLLGGASARR